MDHRAFQAPQVYPEWLAKMVYQGFQALKVNAPSAKQVSRVPLVNPVFQDQRVFLALRANVDSQAATVNEKTIVSTVFSH